MKACKHVFTDQYKGNTEIHFSYLEQRGQSLDCFTIQYVQLYILKKKMVVSNDDYKI